MRSNARIASIRQPAILTDSFPHLALDERAHDVEEDSVLLGRPDSFRRFILTFLRTSVDVLYHRT